MEEKILIFGHKNPDTDTICSSMVKERFNKKTGCKFPKAVRLGNINKETQYVLNYLGLEAPELIENIEEGKVFSCGEVKMWKCRNCGHIHIADSAPEICPVCSHPKAYFELRAQNY